MVVPLVAPSSAGHSWDQECLPGHLPSQGVQQGPCDCGAPFPHPEPSPAGFGSWHLEAHITDMNAHTVTLTANDINKCLFFLLSLLPDLQLHKDSDSDSDSQSSGVV